MVHLLKTRFHGLLEVCIQLCITLGTILRLDAVTQHSASHACPGLVCSAALRWLKRLHLGRPSPAHGQLGSCSSDTVAVKDSPPRGPLCPRAGLSLRRGPGVDGLVRCQGSLGFRAIAKWSSAVAVPLAPSVWISRPCMSQHMRYAVCYTACYYEYIPCGKSVF